MSGVNEARLNGVLSLTLDRPEKKNSLTGAMYEALSRGFLEAAADDDVGVVLIEGSGGAFTAGNDIADFLRSAEASATQASETPAFRFIRTIAAFEKPVVAAVDGVAVGVGTTLCLHCDLVYASPQAQFAMPFVKLGLVPEAGSSLLVPQRFGAARAAEMLLLGDGFDANEARALGLVNAVVPSAELSAHARAKAEALARLPRSALLTTRRLLRGDRSELFNRLDEEARLFAQALRSKEAAAAFAAFLNRPRP